MKDKPATQECVCSRCGRAASIEDDSQVVIAYCEKCNVAWFVKGTPIALG